MITQFLAAVGSANRYKTAAEASHAEDERAAGSVRGALCCGSPKSMRSNQRESEERVRGTENKS